MTNQLRILTLNIGNPSKERALRQVDWLDSRDEDIFVLTETKNSEGCAEIEEYFMPQQLTIFNFNSSNQEYYVHFPKSQTNDLGVMIVSKFPIVNVREHFERESIYYSRIVDVDIKIEEELVRVIGLYVPSRDISERKVTRKKEFIEKVEEILKAEKLSKCIVLGDFNILDRNHVPHYSNFYEWEYEFYDTLINLGLIDSFRYFHPKEEEYSWVGRTGNGYRYDYLFVTEDLLKVAEDCRFVHETRMNGMTDHSGVVLR